MTDFFQHLSVGVVRILTLLHIIMVYMLHIYQLVQIPPSSPGFIADSKFPFSNQTPRRWDQCNGRIVRLMITMTHQ